MECLPCERSVSVTLQAPIGLSAQKLAVNTSDVDLIMPGTCHGERLPGLHMGSIPNDTSVRLSWDRN